jgi:glutamate formiminotransferase / 5-formyltetrahydrofolate cyclo-ligase
VRPSTLLAVPNVSEGRDQALIEELARAFDAQLLDTHSDPDHNRSVFTLAGPPGGLAQAMLTGATEAVAMIDITRRQGLHPRVGAIDVAPIVYLEDGDRGSAAAEALVLADLLGERLELPVFLYGELGGGRTRAELRQGGAARLARRIATGELTPDFGPSLLHPTAGAVLVAARPPLVAFNLQLAPPATLQDARAIAALVREGGAEGLPGLRAIGVALDGGLAQVSMNVERPAELPLARVVQAVRAHAPLASAELVGLAPAGAFAGFPRDLPIPGFDPARHLLENALGC